MSGKFNPDLKSDLKFVNAFKWAIEEFYNQGSKGPFNIGNLESKNDLERLKYF